MSDHGTGIAATRFAYRAARADGRIERGTVDASTRERAVATLADRGLFALELRAARVAAGGERGLSAGDLALGLRILGDLLDAGLPMGRALGALEELAPGRWRVIVPVLRERVRQGTPLSSALAESPVTIPPLVVGLVRAGEAGSGISAAVRRAAEIAEETAALRSALRGALAYPLVLVAAGTVSLAVLTGVVLPRFAAILDDLGQSLPASTRAVIALAGVVRTVALPLGVTMAILLVAVAGVVRTPSGRARWHALLLGIPVLGRLRLARAVAHALAAVGALLDNGVPLSAALRHAGAASGDAAIAGRFARARQEVLHGGRLSRALEQHGAATPTAIRLARAGEESGRLAGMLAHAARIESERTTQLTRAAVRVLEPLLIVIFGGIIAFVAAALLQAMYSLRPGT